MNLQLLWNMPFLLSQHALKSLINNNILRHADAAAIQNKLDHILCPKSPSPKHKAICNNLLIITAARNMQRKATCEAVGAVFVEGERTAVGSQTPVNSPPCLLLLESHPWG